MESSNCREISDTQLTKNILGLKKGRKAPSVVPPPVTMATFPSSDKLGIFILQPPFYVLKLYRIILHTIKPNPGNISTFFISCVMQVGFIQ